MHLGADGARETGYLSLLTSSAGNAGGTTAVIAALSGYGADYLLATPWADAVDLANAGEFRRVISLVGTTVTVANAYTAQVATSTTIDFYPYRPSLYTQALNRASAWVFGNKHIYRYLSSHIISQSDRQLSGNLYSMPRNMREVEKITYWGRLILRATFAAADTASGVSGWTAGAGSIGIRSEQFYFPGDTNADYATRSEKIKNGVWEFSTSGTMESSTVYRTIGLMFHHAVDYAGALDHNNYLVARLLNDAIADRLEIRKIDGGTESQLAVATVALTDGTRAVMRIETVGARIRGFVDDVQLIDYELIGPNLKYADYDRWGLRLDKAGAPGTAANVQELYAHEMVTPIDWTDWQQSRESQTLLIPSIGRRNPTGVLLVEGGEVLTALAADNTQSLVDDGTALLEIATTDPAWQSYIAAAAVELYRMLGYTELRQEAEAALRGMRGMPWPDTLLKAAM